MPEMTHNELTETLKPYTDALLKVVGTLVQRHFEEEQEFWWTRVPDIVFEQLKSLTELMALAEVYRQTKQANDRVVDKTEELANILSEGGD